MLHISKIISIRARALLLDITTGLYILSYYKEKNKNKKESFLLHSFKNRIRMGVSVCLAMSPPMREPYPMRDYVENWFHFSNYYNIY